MEIYCGDGQEKAFNYMAEEKNDNKESVTEERVWEALKKVVEPDLKKDVVTLGAVSDLVVEEGRIGFKVQTKNPAMHSRKRMKEACEFAMERAFGKDITVDVEVVPMEEQQESEENGQEGLMPGVKNLIAIASGKGGVGKSTVTANLAVSLAQQGYRVGLVDADIYGPSIPLMFDLVHDKPKTVQKNGQNLIRPLENYGVKVLSIGFFADVSQAIVWRGPMATKAITQIFRDADWGELDYVLIDLPPGTGDIHLTIVQSVPLTGAVVVSTPQNVALSDARKGVNMFRMESINVPVVGLIENMAYFTPAELPDHKYYIFGQGGVQRLSEQVGTPLLGEVPLVQSIRESGDVGKPAVLQKDTPSAKAFQELSENFIRQVEWRNEHLDPTQRVEVTQK